MARKSKTIDVAALQAQLTGLVSALSAAGVKVTEPVTPKASAKEEQERVAYASKVAEFSGRMSNPRFNEQGVAVLDFKYTKADGTVATREEELSAFIAAAINTFRKALK